MQPECKQCEVCGVTFARPAGRSQAQWERMRFCSTRCANTWRAVHSHGAGARFVGGLGHGLKVRAGIARSARGKRAARKRRQAERHRIAREAMRRQRAQLQFLPRQCEDCGVPILKGRRYCDGCGLIRKREQRSRWNTDNPEYHRLYKRTHRVLRTNAAGTCTHREAKARFDYYGGHCAYCRTSLGGFNEKPRTWHWDHVIPLSRGGTAWPANLRPACADCNRRKCSHLLGEWTGGRLDSALA